MIRKKIRLDTEAYNYLKAAKAEGETFSDVIKRLFPSPRARGKSVRGLRQGRATESPAKGQ